MLNWPTKRAPAAWTPAMVRAASSRFASMPTSGIPTQLRSTVGSSARP
jgi:hypothetical protein